MSPDEMFADESFFAEELIHHELVVQGYKLKVKKELQTTDETATRQKSIGQVLAMAMKRLPDLSPELEAAMQF